MTAEFDFIESLRPLAAADAARNFIDDAAVLDVGHARLIITKDMIAEGVHFLATDPPGDIAWKLLAVNLSDLAAKGARPLGVLLGYSLSGDGAWDAAFAAGLASALRAFGMPLLGGDTISAAPGAPRTFSLTALGESTGSVPSRGGAEPGHFIWVSGTIGDAGAGLELLASGREEPAALIERYRLPRPRLEAGQRLAPLVSAMMDVSDGLLIDLNRMAHASGVAASVELEHLPLSGDFIARRGEDAEARIWAATAGDDYELLFTAPGDRTGEILSLSEQLPMTRIGRVEEGRGLSLTCAGEPVPLPTRFGYEHGAR